MAALYVYNNTIYMEKIYAKERNTCKLSVASPETIRFLLDFSKSLQIVDYQGMQFESNLN